MSESVVLSKYQHVCIVKWNHRFLLLEQLGNIMLASLFPKLCEDFRLAYGNHFYYNLKKKNNLPTLPAT